MNGLNDGLAYALEARDFENFQGMVKKALVLENHRGVMERKCKLVHQHQSSSSSRTRVATSSARHVFRPTQPQFQPRPQAAGQGFSTPQRQVIQHPNNF
jgi:TPP-dependent indolepyruvate ferredoxin oxidoreductase alpha subunit